MTDRGTESYLGVGIYSVPEAAGLTGVSVGRIRRWLEGYTYSYDGTARSSPPVWKPQLPRVDGKLALGFRDLIEVRFVDKFRELGVSWKTLRRAAGRASDLFHTTHPFSTQRFRTDGRSIFAVVVEETGEQSLLDIVPSQYAFRQVLAPYLRGLEFSQNDEVARWWPLGIRRRVVLDPRRSFGQPIVAKEGVPTSILARAAKVEGSIDSVAEWFEVEHRSVRDAVEFEEKLVA